jgi:hypothetical protein
MLGRMQRVELGGAVVTLAGRLETMTRTEAQQQLRAAGARVAKSLVQDVTYLVAGRLPGPKLEQARLRRVPILTEADLVAALAGESVALAADEPKDSEGNDVFSKLSELLTRDVTHETWTELCEALDELPPEALSVATDMVLAAHEPWEPELWDMEKDLLIPSWGFTPRHQAPVAWLAELLAGESSPKLRIVQILQVRNKKLTGRSFAPLLSCSDLCNVRALELSENKLPAKSFVALGQTPQLSDVRYFRARGAVINQRAARGLARLSDLRAIDLQYGDLRGGGVVGLVGDGTLPKLEHLSLRRTKIGAEDLAALATAEHLTALKMLDLGENELDRKEMSRLLAAPQLAGLRRLDVAYCQLGNWFAEALANATQLTALEQVRVESTGLGRALDVLSAVPHLAEVELIR